MNILGEKHLVFSGFIYMVHKVTIWPLVLKTEKSGISRNFTSVRELSKLGNCPRKLYKLEVWSYISI